MLANLADKGHGPTPLTVKALELARHCSGEFGGLSPWRAGGGLLEMPAREYEAVTLARATLNAAKPKGGA